MRWLVIALFAGLGYFIFSISYKSDAYETYLRFDRARLVGDCLNLRLLADGPARDWADDYCRRSGADTMAALAAIAEGGADAAYADAASAGGLDTLQDAAGIHLTHKHLSETENPDDTVLIEAAVVPVDRKNDPANKKFMPSKHRHRVTLKPKGSGYVVVEFVDEVVRD
jgi:hypothetical protein